MNTSKIFEKEHTSISYLFCSVNILLTPLYSKAQKKKCKIGTKGRGEKYTRKRKQMRIALKCWGGEGVVRRART